MSTIKEINRTSINVAEPEVVKPGYKRTELGVIPKKWEVRNICSVADVTTGPFGSSLHESDYVDDGTPIITVEHLSDHGVIHNHLPLVSDTDKLRLKSYVLRRNDIVFSRVGSVDRNSLITEDEDGWLFSGRLLRVRITHPLAHSPYLSYHFHSEPFKQRVRSVAVGQTMASLNTQILKGIDVVLPTLPEQRTIAKALSDVDGLIHAQDKLIAKKRAIKQAAMQQLITGKKRLPGFDEDWEEKLLGDLLEKIIGGGTPSRTNPKYWGNEIPWVTVKDFATFNAHMTQEAITKEGLQHSATYLIPKGTLITSTRMALGKAVIYYVDVCINQDLKALFPKNKLDTNYLYYWFEHNSGIIDELGSGSTVKGISLPDLKALRFYCPPVPEQKSIATVLSNMDKDIAALELRRDKTTAIKQGMMQEQLNGRTRLI